MERLLATSSEIDARQLFTLCSQSQWNYARAKKELADGAWRQQAIPLVYRPFDVRWTIWNSNVSVHRRERVMRHMLGHDNIGLVANRQVNGDPNLAPDFLGALSKALGGASLSPEDVFGYIYAMLYSPSYRSHYGDFLKRDFPRVPLPHSATFARLAVLGHELMKLHLLKKVEPAITRYPKAGSNRVEKVEFKPDATDPTRGCVFINGAQFFEGVPTDVWEYAIGGYQVAHKWFKDRKDRLLTFDELKTYGNIISALAETIRLQGEIDEVLSPLPQPRPRAPFIPALSVK